jgi:predicted secreted protein
VYIIVRFMAKILKAENIQTDLLGSNGNGAFSLQRNNSSLLTLHTNDYVGVNTTAPSHLFEVRGSSTPKICLTSDDQLIDQGATFRIDLKNASSSLFEAGNISVRHTSSNQTSGSESSYMSFFTRNTGAVAEKMRILNTGSVGIGTTSPAARLHVAGGSIRLDDDYTLSWGGTANTILGNNASNYLRFTTNSVVSMVIASNGNVGIGTTSPARLLTVDNATNPEIGLYTGGTERVKFSTGGSAQSVLTIDIGGTERLRIDSTGDVGIGVTPSAWSSSYVALQIGGSTSIWTDKTAGLRTFISTNLFFDGTNRKYIATGAASEYLQGTDGSHAWYSAASGSAGSNITFTERLRIDSNGNVGIGTASPAVKLDVRGSSTYLINSTSPTAWVSADSNLNSSIYSQFNTTENAGIFGSYSNHPIYFVTNNTERLRINSSGTVSIAGNLTLSGQSYFVATTITNSGASYSWNLNTNQVARLTLNGNKTLNNPTNQNAGAVYILIVTQSSSGSNTLAFDTAYKFPGGVTPTISTTANKVDVLTFVSDGTNMLGVATQSYL